MEAISSALSHVWSILAAMRVTDAIDILIVAYLIYRAIWLVRRTNFYNLAKGLLLFLVVLGLSELLKLKMINFVLRKMVELGLIALLVLFQPELRRMLERVGSTLSSNRKMEGPVMEAAIEQTVQACADMSASKTGALIIFERSVRLSSIMNTGTVINADATAELIKNIFFNKAPLHDGALIMRGGRMAAAGCVLPLTKNTNLSKELGMRHRAGIGLSEEADAVVVIVSEETGAISVAIDGRLKRHLTAEALNRLLRKELMSDEDLKEKKGVRKTIKKLFAVNSEGEVPDEKTL